MSKVFSARVSDEFAQWFDEYAVQRKVSRQALLETALVGFREDAESGVPELREMARRQSSVDRDAERGVGSCPRREPGLGHVWRSPQEDPVRPCRFCGLAGRGAGGHLSQATAERTELFTRLVVPMQSGTGDPAKARPKGSK